MPNHWQQAVISSQIIIPVLSESRGRELVDAGFFFCFLLCWRNIPSASGTPPVNRNILFTDLFMATGTLPGYQKCMQSSLTWIKYYQQLGYIMHVNTAIKSCCWILKCKIPPSLDNTLFIFLVWTTVANNPDCFNYFYYKILQLHLFIMIPKKKPNWLIHTTLHKIPDCECSLRWEVKSAGLPTHSLCETRKPHT